MRVFKDETGSAVPIITPKGSTTAAYTGTSAQSGAVKSTVVRLVSTTDCFVDFGTNPTATTSHIFLPAYSVEYFGLNVGDKVAAIRASADGTLYVTEAG